MPGAVAAAAAQNEPKGANAVPLDITTHIDRQLQRWEDLRLRSDRRWPVITISRQYGTPGAELARALADRLDFTFWDREIVEAIAEATGLDAAFLSSLDEHQRLSMEALIEGMLHGALSGVDDYHRGLLRVLHTIGSHGSAIVVGRGAQFVLTSDAALHVRVVAPIEARAHHVATTHGWSDSRARRELEQVDAERASFVRRHFQRDVDDASAYDLILNTATLQEHAVDLVLLAYSMRFGELPDWADPPG